MDAFLVNKLFINSKQYVVLFISKKLKYVDNHFYLMVLFHKNKFIFIYVSKFMFNNSEQ